MESKGLPYNRSNNTEKRVKRKEIFEKKTMSLSNQPLLIKTLLLLSRPFATSTETGPYGSEWPMEERVKRREMVAPEARYIFVHEAPNASACEVLTSSERKRTCTNCDEDNEPMVGFVHYRFVVEEDIPVLYVYELQLKPHVQAKGLGKFLMQLIELIACKNRMSAVILTVQKANSLAVKFYLNKLRYVVSATSPSRIDLLIGIEKGYEILCKAFDHEAKAVLEERS